MRNTLRATSADKYYREKINKSSLNRNQLIASGAVLLLAFGGIHKLSSNTALAPQNAAETNLPLGNSPESSNRVKTSIKSQRIKHAKRACERTKAELSTNYSKLQQNNVRLWQNVNKSALQPSPLTSEGRELMQWTDKEVCNAMEGTHLVATTETLPLLGKARDAILKYKGTDASLISLRSVYDKIGDDETHLHRLMAKRPLAYFGKYNNWLLRNGAQGKGVAKYLASVNLEDYLHPAEAIIAGYFGIMNRALIVNTGSRDNRAEPDITNAKQHDAGVFALVGARMEKKNIGEWKALCTNCSDRNPLEDVVHTFLQETVNNLNLGKDVEYSMNNDRISYNLYVARTYLVINTMFQHVLKHATRDAKVVVTGLGLGVWSGESKNSKQAYVNGVICCVNRLPMNQHIKEISMVHFDTYDINKKLTQAGKEKNINITWKKSNAFENTSMDLYTVYAWDSMSYQGNEYWLNMLSASMDPATCAATTIPFLGIPETNPDAFKRVEVATVVVNP